MSGTGRPSVWSLPLPPSQCPDEDNEVRDSRVWKVRRGPILSFVDESERILDR